MGLSKGVFIIFQKQSKGGAMDTGVKKNKFLQLHPATACEQMKSASYANIVGLVGLYYITTCLVSLFYSWDLKSESQ